MQENPPEDLSVTEHVREAWRLLLHLPDGVRERVTEHLAACFPWSQVEAGTTAMRADSLAAGGVGAATDAMGTPTGRASRQDELAEITADVTPADVVKVRSLVEALRDGVVTVAELHELPDREWMALIASRRAA
jgi:hypothetical protein